MRTVRKFIKWMVILNVVTYVAARIVKQFFPSQGDSTSAHFDFVTVRMAGDAVVASGTDVAAELLQAAPATVSFADGKYRAGSGATVALAEVAAAAHELRGTRLVETVRYDRGATYTFPNGAHVAEVEVDPETGVVEVIRYTAVDDCGRVINPLLASGQVHGGVVQGLGQALLEEVRYDDYGQLQSGSLMDYGMPRAHQVPDVGVSFNEVPDPNNELGVKGIGEGGACAAPSALVNAVLDALRCRGVEHLDMPLSAEKVWRALREAAR